MASSSQLHSLSSIRDSLSNDPETNKHDTKIEHIDRVPTGAARDITALRGDVIEEDAVFGVVDEGGPNFRNLGWKGTTALMMKTQIGIGVLSIPKTFHTFGLVPGLIILLVVAIITTWSDYIVGCFKLRHRQVYGLDDAGFVMFGRLGREILGGAFCLYYIFVSASAILGVSISLNALSSHGACTAIFLSVASIVAFCFSSIRTLSKLSWIAFIGVCSVILSIFVLTIAVGVQDRPADAPQEGTFTPDFLITANPSAVEAFSGVATIIFAFSGTPSFFPIIAEMRDPAKFSRAVFIAQGTVTTLYAVIGIVVYYYAGSYVSSPALGSAGTLMKKVCYGIALPGLVVTTMLVSHLPAKYFFVRIARGSRHLAANTWQHWAIWLSCNFGVVLCAYIIASAIPSFDTLVALIGAFLGTLMCFAPMGCMWLYDNYSTGERTNLWVFMVGWSVFVIVIGTFCMVAGSYGAIVGIVNEYSGENGSSAWSCADNSHSS